MTDKPNIFRRVKAAIIHDCTVPNLTWPEAFVFSMGTGAVAARDWWTAAVVLGVFIVLKVTREIKQEGRHD